MKGLKVYNVHSVTDAHCRTQASNRKRNDSANIRALSSGAEISWAKWRKPAKNLTKNHTKVLFTSVWIHMKWMQSTGNGNSFYLLTLASNFSWNHLRSNLFLVGLSHFKPLCEAATVDFRRRPPFQKAARLSHCVIASTSTIEAFKLRKPFMRPRTLWTVGAWGHHCNALEAAYR